MVYDVIGDIHGQADKLKGLLSKLGYHHNGDHYEPPKGHQAIFIGDLIDRGNQEVETLQIVFAMIDAGVAHAVMGNHEYNALAYATLNHIKNNGEYLRSHQPNHQRQHQAFLDEVPFGSSQHQYWLNRFFELPLWLETKDACFVHACWDSKSMNVLKPLLTPSHQLTAEGLQQTGQKDSPAYQALERILKGVESPLPDGLSFTDKDGSKRHHVRIQWWQYPLNGRKLLDIVKAPASDLSQIPATLTTKDIDFILDNQTTKPIFIGHYWLSGEPKPLSHRVVCTDYSAAIETGFLTCYQFDTNNPLPLSKENFVQFLG